MDNNEQFNQLLNSCQHSRAVYNALFSWAAFIAYQEQIKGRCLSDAEKALMEVWWPLIADADQETIATVDELIAQHHSDKWMNKFLTAVKAWMMEAVVWKHRMNC